MVRIQKGLAGAIAAVSLTCCRYAKATVALTLVATLVFGYGVTLITTNVDVADVLPRGNPNTDAAHKLTKDFRSTFTQQVTFQVHVDDEPGNPQWTKDNQRLQYRGQTVLLGSGTPGGTVLDGLPLPLPPSVGPVPINVQPNPLNITDEVYVRAIEEMVRFIQARTDFDRSISIAGIYSLVNWTVAGGQGQAPLSAYSLPGYATPADAQRYLVVDQAVKAALLDTVDAISSPSWNHAATLFSPEATNREHTKVLGESIIAARDAYVAAVAAGETQFTVFGPANPPLLTVDLPVANAHSSALVQQDTVRLMPIIAAFIVVCLFVAFRNFRAIAVSFTTLGLGVVWTYGVMGHMGIALNTLNMTVVPLIMGIGIDYAIHMINEFSEHKSHGLSNEEAFRVAGSRAGVALFIATVTTVLGLLVMMVSPSLLIAQLGLLSAIAISALYVLAITFIPAALTLVGGSEGMGASFKPSRAMPALARGVTKVRWLVLVLVVAFSALAWYGSTQLGKEAFGDPGKNYPEGDPIRREHEQGLSYFYETPDPDVKANILTFEGPGILTPDSIQFMRAIEQNLRAKERVIPDTLRTLPFFIETWLTVKDGAPGAATQVGLEELLARGVLPGPVAANADRFPATEAEIRSEVNQMFDSPMAQLSSIIINHPKLDMAAMTFSVRAGTYDEAEAVWHQVWDAVAQANKTFGGQPPAGVRVAFVGNTATNYLFIAEELPWLGYMGIAGNVVLAVLVIALMRSWRATIVVMALSSLTTLWWLGVLPQLGIGLAITLTLPLIFISAVGTDYAVHLIQNIRTVGNAREVFATTGKGVMFSFITTTLAFLVFTFIQNVAVSRTMMATAVAMVLIFLATMLVIPIFYPVRREGHGRKPPAAAFAPAAATPVAVAAKRPAAGASRWRAGRAAREAAREAAPAPPAAQAAPPPTRPAPREAERNAAFKAGPPLAARRPKPGAPQAAARAARPPEGT